MRKPIRSSDNPRWKAAIKLLSNRGRGQQNRIAIFGAREAQRAWSAGAQFEEIFIGEGQLDNEVRDFLEVAESSVPVWELSAALFQRLSYGDRPDLLVAVARRPDTSLARIRLSDSALVIVLEAVEKPGNIGAVARSADAVGASALLLADPICDLFHPNCIRASLGSVFQLAVATGSSQEIRDWLLAERVAIIAARTDATLSYTEVDFRRPSAIVLGSEARGLSDPWRGSGITEVRLPMRGISDSLNVSVTAAVLMFEANRQRTLNESSR